MIISISAAHFYLVFVVYSLLKVSSTAPNKRGLDKILVPGNVDTESNREKVREIMEKAFSQKKHSIIPEVTKLPWDLNSTLEDLGITFGPISNLTQMTLAELNKDVIDYMFEADILLNEEQATSIAAEIGTQNETRSKRQANTNPNALWNPYYYVPYEFDTKLTVANRQNIFKAITFWQDNSCLRFREDQTAFNRLFLTAAGGCFSYVGRQATSASQIVALGPGCDSLGIATHELAHALGFFHQQSRFDRDNYVVVNTNNIQPGQQLQFQKFSGADTLGLPYDYGSVMHYGPHDFATDPKKFTLYAKDARYQNTIGQRESPAFSDVRMVNKLYDCPARCSNTLNCQNCGFVVSLGCKECICPRYFGGKTCETIKRGTAPVCSGEVLQAELSGWKRYIGTYGSAMKGTNDDCHWHIKAPAGARIELIVSQFPSFACMEQCPNVSLEINTGKFDLYGMIMCCTMRGSVPLISESNMMALRGLVRNNVVTFEITYRAVNRGTPINYNCTK